MIAAVALIAFSDIEQREVTLTNRNPVRVVQILSKALGPTGTLIPSKVAATPDDGTKKIKLRGEAALLDPLEKKLAFFDQPRIKIVAQITIRSRIDKAKNDYMIELENGSDWRMTDTDCGATVRLWPLILGDGSFRIYATFTAEGPTTRTVTNLKPTETLVLRPAASAILKSMSGDISGMNITWTAIPFLSKDAARWYVTEGPDPVAGPTSAILVDKLDDPIFTATFKVSRAPKG